MTYLNIQKFSIVLLIPLFEDLSLNVIVNEKVYFRISVLKFGILILRNISLALLRREICKILWYKATRIFDNDDFFKLSP